MWKMIREEASQQSHPIFHRRSGDMSTSPLRLEKYKISKMYYVRMYQILFSMCDVQSSVVSKETNSKNVGTQP